MLGDIDVAANGERSDVQVFIPIDNNAFSRAQIGHDASYTYFLDPFIVGFVPADFVSEGLLNQELGLGLDVNLGPISLAAGDIDVRATGNVQVFAEQSGSFGFNQSRIGHSGSSLSLVDFFCDDFICEDDLVVRDSSFFNGFSAGGAGPVILIGDIYAAAGQDLDVVAELGENLVQIGHFGQVAEEMDFGFYDNELAVPVGLIDYGFGLSIDLPPAVVAIGDIDASAGNNLNVRSQPTFTNNKLPLSVAQIGHRGEIDGVGADRQLSIPLGLLGLGEYGDRFGFEGGLGGPSLGIGPSILIVGDITTRSRGFTTVRAINQGIALIGHAGDLAVFDTSFGMGRIVLPGGPTFAVSGVFLRGDIDVSAGTRDQDSSVLVQGGTGSFGISSNFAQIGHDGSYTHQSIGRGMYELPPYGVASPGPGGGSGGPGIGPGVFINGDIYVRASQDVTVQAGAPGMYTGPTGIGNVARIGHRARAANSIGDIPARPGFASEQAAPYMSIGLGVPLETRTNGNIFVLARRNVGVSALGLSNWAQIGHDSNVGSGLFTRVAADSLTNGDFMYGRPAPVRSSARGDIKVVAVENNVSINSTGRGGNVAQIGHDVGSGFNLADTRTVLLQDGPYNGLRGSGRATGNIFVLAGNDIFINATAAANESHIGHGRGGGQLYRLLAGDIVAIAGQDFTLRGGEFSPAQVGHGGPWSDTMRFRGDVILAWDQNSTPLDGGGRFFMNEFARVDAGAAVVEGTPRGRVLLFANRRDTDVPAGPVNVIEDGAFINGVVYNAALEDTATRTPTQWGENVEFEDWEAEQWGFFLSDALLNDGTFLEDCFVLIDPAFIDSVYDAPFTFYYAERDFDIPEFPYDQYVRYEEYVRTIHKLFPILPYFANYGDSFDHSSLLTGEDSAGLFGEQEEEE